MTNSVNLTVRLDADLNKNFDTACEYLGLNKSDVVRRAIRQTINDYRIRHKTDREYATNIMQETEALEQYNVLAAYLEVKRIQALEKINNGG